MKKHMDEISKLKSASELVKKSSELMSEMIVLKKGIRMGDVQNYKKYAQLKRQRARVLTAMKNAPVETKEVKEPAKTGKKGSK